MGIILKDVIDLDEVVFSDELLVAGALSLGREVPPLNIFLDDVRLKPERYDMMFKNAESLLQFLANFPDVEIKVLSLDHDLGEGIMDGYDFVKELVNLDKVPKIETIQFHTDNMVGFKNMYYYLTSAQNHGMIKPEIVIDNRKWEVVDGVETPLYTPIGNG